MIRWKTQSFILAGAALLALAVLFRSGPDEPEGVDRPETKRPSSHAKDTQGAGRVTGVGATASNADESNLAEEKIEATLSPKKKIVIIQKLFHSRLEGEEAYDHLSGLTYPWFSNEEMELLRELKKDIPQNRALLLEQLQTEQNPETFAAIAQMMGELGRNIQNPNDPELKIMLDMIRQESDPTRHAALAEAMRWQLSCTDTLELLKEASSDQFRAHLICRLMEPQFETLSARQSEELLQQVRSLANSSDSTLRVNAVGGYLAWAFHSEKDQARIIEMLRLDPSDAVRLQVIEEMAYAPDWASGHKGMAAAIVESALTDSFAEIREGAIKILAANYPQDPQTSATLFTIAKNPSAIPANRQAALKRLRLLPVLTEDVQQQVPVLWLQVFGDKMPQ